MPLISNLGPPAGVKLMGSCCPATSGNQLLAFRVYILFLTFFAYTCYHMSRKPISVVKTRLLNCTELGNTTTCTSFINQINGVTEEEGKRLEGALDTAYLFSYAFFMFVSGAVAERVDLRLFLSMGMLFSGIFTMAFGMAYYWGIHTIAYFLLVQIIGGAFQTTGWPGVVTVVANWFGQGKKGLIFGIWNSHTSIGNILGSLLAGVFVEDSWGLSFIVPGAIIALTGILFWFILVPRPEDVGLDAEHNSAISGMFQESHSNSISGNGSRGSLGGSSSSSSNNLRAATPSVNRPLLAPEEAAPLLPAEDEPEVAFSNPAFDGNKPFGDWQSSSTRTVSESSVTFGQGDVEDRPPSRRHRLISVTVDEGTAITLWGALKIPGVLEFSLCLFFSKLVSYTFLYWLPSFIIETGINVSSENAAYLSTLFDVGGIVGGILAGVISDFSGRSASTCALMLVGAIPLLFSYQAYGVSCPLDWDHREQCYAGHVGLLVVLGLLVNGPYALITTAVSAELGTHPCLRGTSSKALATVTSIIDGTGSIGAAIGPFLAGAIPGFNNVFYMLMAADIVALLLLSRLVKKDLQSLLENRMERVNMNRRQS